MAKLIHQSLQIQKLFLFIQRQLYYLLNVDFTKTEENIAIYISDTNDSSKIGEIRIQSYYSEENSEYYKLVEIKVNMENN